MKEKFYKNEEVSKQGKIGNVIKISEQAVHVKYKDGFFEKFHFNPTHHKQTSISELKKNEIDHNYKTSEEELQEMRKKYKNGEIEFKELDKFFFENASTEEINRFWNAPVFDRPNVVIGKTQEEMDTEFDKIWHD